MTTRARRVFVAGCGFTGLAAARLLASRGWEVFGGTSSDQSAAALCSESFPVLACDLTDRGAIEKLGAELRPVDAVIHAASSGRGGAEAYRAIYMEGCRNLLRAFSPCRLLFTSSTSVYAQVDGEWVTEESPAEPDRETGRILLEAEHLVLAAGGCVARLGGIYGPGRSVLLRKFLAGEAVIEDGGYRWINQIHRDDAATALATLVENQAEGIYNVSDGSPLAQRELYAWLAQRFERPLPPPAPADHSRKRGWTHKRVANAKLRGAGWQPEFASFYEAVARDGRLLEGALEQAKQASAATPSLAPGEPPAR